MSAMLRNLGWICTIAVLLLITACGEDECRSDYDCDSEEVCEPAGCRISCEDDEDCPAGRSCELRRVEDGKYCAARQD